MTNPNILVDNDGKPLTQAAVDKLYAEVAELRKQLASLRKMLP